MAAEAIGGCPDPWLWWSSDLEMQMLLRGMPVPASATTSPPSPREPASTAPESQCEAADGQGQAAAPASAAEAVPQEIEVKTNWSRLLEGGAKPTSKQVKDREIWLVKDLLSDSECTKLLNRAEGYGFGKTNFPKSYRGNLRLTAVDPGLARALWGRLRPLVPATFVCKEGRTWDAVGLNEHWRLAKYHPGDRFMGHYDASYHRSSGERSMITVNIYLNGGFEGGRTRFFFSADESRADLAVTPKTGLCLLFRQPPGQSYYHDGEELRSGLKYLLRTDLMYQQRPQREVPSNSKAVHS